MAQEPLRLGTLAPELFDKIFFELGTIRDLASFVFTARFVYHRFELQRRTILFRVLQNELGLALPDARFLFIFPYSDPTDEVRYYDWIDIMTGVYREMLRGEGDPGPPHLKELTELCRTLRSINFITDIYATALLGWFDFCGGGGTLATTPLSYQERRRIKRAFYLRQIVSNAWASTRRLARWTDRDSNAFGSAGREQDESLGLFSAFKPWDLQYVDHANSFIKRLCCALVCRAPEVAGEGAREISSRQFGDLYAQQDHLVRYLQIYPGVAKAAVGDIQSGTVHPRDESLYKEFVYRYQLLPLTYAWQNQRAKLFPEPILNKQEQHTLDMDDPGQVPFGWLDALRGRYTCCYGQGLSAIPWLPPWESSEKHWVHNCLLDLWRHCGFTLWDRERVEALRGLKRFEALQTGFLLDRS
ncbi:hypothetical protein B0I37DRAFT_384133 [Chaetomium sp. MPI-CAGE-AT-0009]|nr:hypothetical protein B0I37DRAFT_384133 [Chaetomium sp. MPI-CAGE-AT-0009]